MLNRADNWQILSGIVRQTNSFVYLIFNMKYARTAVTKKIRTFYEWVVRAYALGGEGRLRFS